MVIVLFSVGRVYNLSGFYDDESVLAAAFPAPVSQSLARQARLLATEMTGFSGTVLGASPAMDASLANVQGADVLLIFIESYGAVSWDHESLAGRLTSQRAHLEDGHPRHRTRCRVGVRGVAHLRRQLVAGSHQPAVGTRDPR